MPRGGDTSTPRSHNPTTYKAVRWEIGAASNEFQIDYKTLSKRLKQQGIEPGEDGKWSTAQMAKAVFGDMEGAKLAKLNAEKDLLEIELAKERATLVSAEMLGAAFEKIFVPLRQHIRNSGLAYAEKERILTELREQAVAASLQECINFSRDADEQD